MGNSLPGRPQAEGGPARIESAGNPWMKQKPSQDRGREPEVRQGAFGIRPIKGQTRRESGVQGWGDAPPEGRTNGWGLLG